MPEPQTFQCPNCQADLDDDLVRSTGSSYCPFCGHDVSSVYEPATKSEPATEQPAQPEHDVPDSAATDPRTPPPGSRIQVVEASPARWVAAIPPGGKSARAIGCFALFWNGFMAVFTVFMGGAALQGGDGDLSPWFVFLFLGLFWAIGLGMAYFWIRMKFMTTYVLLEPHRVAIQRILFGRKSTSSAELEPGSRADLEEMYSQNDEPVYCVAVEGSDRTEKFGTRLSWDEKDWLRTTINAFLEQAAPRTTGPNDDAARE